MASANAPGAKPSLHPLQMGRGSMSRLVCSSKSLLTNQPSHVSATQSSQHPDHLTHLESFHVSTFLSECINQLTLIHNILPRPASSDKSRLPPLPVQPLVNTVLAPQLTEMLSLGEKLDQEIGGLPKGKASPSYKESKSEAVRDILSKMGPRGASRDESLRSSAAQTAENQLKMVEDVQFIIDTLEKVQMEVSEDGRFPTLVRVVREHEEEKERVRQIVQSAQDAELELRRLREQKQSLEKKHKEEMEQCKEEIAYVKDQIQEIKKSSGVNIRYVKKSCQLDNAIHLKKCKMEEEEMRNNLERKRNELALEKTVHKDIEEYLKKCIEELQDKLDYWMNKYENDTDEKANELREAEENLAECNAKIDEQTRKFEEYSQVVESYKLEKEQERLQEEQQKRELEATVRIQAWWRGTMQRNQLGPFRPKKGKKASKKKGDKKKKRA